MTHAAILLAAGGSTRLGTPKQLLTRNGVPLVRYAATLLTETHPTRLVVVTGGASEAVMHALRGLPLRCVFNPRWQSGLASSLICAVEALTSQESCALICGTDQPDLTVEHLQALLKDRPQNGNIITGYGNGNGEGIPACLDRHTLARVPELSGDTGFRHLWKGATLPKRHDNPLLALDIDTPAQYAAAIARGALDVPK